MDPQNQFFSSVHHWLSSEGWDILTDVKNVFVSEIQIVSQDKIMLIIGMVSITGWIEEGDSELEFRRYFEEMETRRKTGFQNIIIWEDQWIVKKAIVKSRVLALLGVSQRVPGRLTKVSRIDKKTAFSFLAENHLQGAVSSKTQYGLYLPKRYFRVLDADFQSERSSDELLVAVATFSHPRIFFRAGKSFRSFELVRFCNLLGSTVVGGLDKLLHAFIHDFQPGDIMTYADLEWSDGKSYQKLGFEPVSTTQPMHFLLDKTSNERHFGKDFASVQGDIFPIMNAGSRKFVKSFHEENVIITKPSRESQPPL